MNDHKKTYTITVAEPWNFESSDGNNVIQGIILSIVNSYLLVFKANYMLDFDGISGKILILSPRFKNGNFDNIATEKMDVNGGLLLVDYQNELKERELKDNCRFVVIGTIDS